MCQVLAAHHYKITCGSRDDWAALKEHADKGVLLACAMVAVCYVSATVCIVPKDVDQANKWASRAFEWTRQESDGGCMYAQAFLGYFHEFGIGVSQKNEAEAAKLYRLAADQGNTDGQYSLGVCYEYGRGVTKDEEEAVGWYRLAAEQGHAAAQKNLGRCYAYGTGVTKDESEAVGWFRLAADQGHAAAQCSLGVCYATGRGVTKDEGEAVRWYRLAADQGNAAALSNLGVHYANGTGWLMMRNKQLLCIGWQMIKVIPVLMGLV
jgi:TPR repeat protein